MMKRSWIGLLILACLGGSLLLGVRLASAVASDTYSIDWWTADGGGGTSNATAYSLSGTIGQAEAGEMSGGGYSLVGGYWGAAPQESHRIYLPLLVRPAP